MTLKMTYFSNVTDRQTARPIDRPRVQRVESRARERKVEKEGNRGVDSTMTYDQFPLFFDFLPRASEKLLIFLSI